MCDLGGAWTNCEGEGYFDLQEHKMLKFRSCLGNRSPKWGKVVIKAGTKAVAPAYSKVDEP